MRTFYVIVHYRAIEGQISSVGGLDDSTGSPVSAKSPLDAIAQTLNQETDFVRANWIDAKAIEYLGKDRAGEKYGESVSAFRGQGHDVNIPRH